MGRRPPARKPSFLKILVNDFSKKLLIPPKFVRLHRGTLARKCFLRPTGTQDSWRVRTKQINNSLYFKKGWKKFAEHHSLEFGDLLVFRYAQDCEFYVDMFDKSCCSKEPVTFHNVESRRDTTPILSSKGKKANPKTLALDAAEKFMANSEFPTFNKIMQWAYVRDGGYLPLKSDFAKMHFKDNTRKVKIEVSDKTWTVGVAREGWGYRLSRCWGHLATEHALNVGDVCVFQLINTEDYTLKLSIFSSTRENKTCQSKARPGRPGKAVEAQSSQALEAANKFSSLSKYPSCPCIMHFTYVRKNYLHVPITFVKQMNATDGANKVKLQCWGKEWDAVIIFNGISSRINNGWSTFAKENSLHIGDACVLELINREDALIRVTIFKWTN